jgi:ribosomal protein L19
MFKAGDVLKVFYFLTLTRFRKMFSFVGLCTHFSSKTFTIRNFYGSEFVTINFLINSPNIVKIDKLTSYNFKFKKSRLNNLKRFRLIGRTDLLSEKPVDSRKDPLSFFFKSRNITSKEKKRLRNKFRL